MKMRLELLIPGVKDGYKAQFPSKLVTPKLKQGPGNGLEEDIAHHGFVVEDEGVELMGQGEDDMEIGNREDLLFSGLKPTLSWYVLTLGTVPVAA